VSDDSPIGQKIQVNSGKFRHENNPPPEAATLPPPAGPAVEVITTGRPVNVPRIRPRRRNRSSGDAWHDFPL
jgi:hypothetical protein